MLFATAKPAMPNRTIEPRKRKAGLRAIPQNFTTKMRATIGPASGMNDETMRAMPQFFSPFWKATTISQMSDARDARLAKARRTAGKVMGVVLEAS